MKKYDGWVRQLLTLGKVDMNERWLDYRALGVAPEHVPELLRLLDDRALARQKDEVLTSAPVHAWRALAQLGEAAGNCSRRLLAVLHWRAKLDDITMEEMPQVLAALGPAGLADMLPMLKESADHWGMLTVLNAVEMMVAYYPPVRARVQAAILAEAWRFAKKDAKTNGYLLTALANLRAPGTEQVLAAAFAADAVDMMVGGTQAELLRVLRGEEDIDDMPHRTVQEFERRLRCGRTMREWDAAACQFADCYYRLPVPLIQERLRRLGIDIDETTFQRLVVERASAEKLLDGIRKWHEDGLPLAERRAVMLLDALWHHWLPQRPSEERLLLALRQAERWRLLGTEFACMGWRNTWSVVHAYAAGNNCRTFADLSRREAGMEALVWLEDLETDFYNVAMPDERIDFCSAVIEQFAGDPDTVSTFRRGLADAWREKAGRAHAERMYRDWLRDDPRWGWGWIGMCDLYRVRGAADPARAEAILREGLAIDGVRDRSDMLMRLSQVLEEAGRKSEAEGALTGTEYAPEEDGDGDDLDPDDGDAVLADEEFARWRARHEMPVDLSWQKPVTQVRRNGPKVGRNDPCPCGSGRKYKHCCGK